MLHIGLSPQQNRTVATSGMSETSRSISSRLSVALA